MARIQYIAFIPATKQQIGRPQATPRAAREIARQHNQTTGHDEAVAKRFISAEARIDISVEMLQAKFPNLNITYGYIGNCGVNSQGPFDDRSWRIFTTAKRPGGTECITIHLSGPDFDVIDVALTLEALAEDARVHLGAAA